MSNYPAGAENDKNAPFNKEERLQGEEIGLFEYLENLEMPYEVRCKLKNFIIDSYTAKKVLESIIDYFKDKDAVTFSKARVVKKLISEPQIFIENE
jgi:hypothetical protein